MYQIFKIFGQYALDLDSDALGPDSLIETALVSTISTWIDIFCFILLSYTNFFFLFSR
jgi:hypothetical protein